MRPRRLLILGTTGLLVTLVAGPAFADGPGGWVDVDPVDGDAEFGARDGGHSGGGGGSSGCAWSRVPEGEVASVWWEVGSDVGAGDGEGDVDPTEYAWYWVTCPDGAGGETLDLIPVALDRPPVDPADLLVEAIDRLSLPVPTIAMNPAGDQVVHVASWLWIDDAIWRTHTKSVSAGGVTTTVTASPKRVIWDLGNGDRVVCDGPGVAYDRDRRADQQSTDCSYTYTNSSAGRPGEAYRVTATVEWGASWSVAGAPGGGALPAMVTASPTSVRVAEMQALNQ